MERNEPLSAGKRKRESSTIPVRGLLSQLTKDNPSSPAHIKRNTRFMTPRKKRSSPTLYSSSFSLYDTEPQIYSTDLTCLTKKPCRAPSSTFTRVLDAPGLNLDFCSNVMDWSENEVLAIALCSQVFLWYEENSEVMNLPNLTASKISALAWQTEGNLLAVSTSHNSVHILEPASNTSVYKFKFNTAKINTLAFQNNLLAAAGASGKIELRDVRDTKCAFRIKTEGNQDVTSLAWNGDWLSYVTLQGKSCVFDLRTTQTLSEIELGGKSKSQSWSKSSRGKIALGSSSVIIYDVLTNSTINEASCEGLLHGLCWEDTGIIACVGSKLRCFNEELTLTSEASGHLDEIQHVACSRNRNLVTSAADETLRFWDLLK